MNMEHFPTDWSELPGDLLGQITEKLISSSGSLSDYVGFCAVCVRWRSYLIQNYGHFKLPSQIPILLIPSLPIEGNNKDGDRYGHRRSFYSLTERKVYDFQLPVPSSYYKSCCGSSHGWLVVLVDEKDENCSVGLLNPFRSVNYEIQLPTLTRSLNENASSSWFRERSLPWIREAAALPWIRKAVLSASPSSNPIDFVVMLINDHCRLGFCRPGDTIWTSLPSEYTRPFDDVIYYKGQFYATYDTGFVLAIDVGSDHPEPNLAIIAYDPPKGSCILDRKYLVESSGDLLQVHRSYHHGFKVFKLVGFSKWTEMKTLDGHILFLGYNASLSLSASDFPGGQPNCIYFTDDRPENSYYPYRRLEDMACYNLEEGGDDTEHYHYPYHGFQDMGIFNLVEESFEAHYPMELKSTNVPFAIWIQPTP